MIFSKVLFLYLLLSISTGYQYKFKSEDFKLVIDYKRNGLAFEGVKMDKEGLTLGRYFYENRFLSKPSFEYESILISLNDLDPIALYRLEMFLFHNNNLKNIDISSFFEVQRCPQKNVYFIRNNGEENLIVDTNYCQNPCYNVDVYLLDELEYLVNNIIPERYEKFRLSSYSRPCRD